MSRTLFPKVPRGPDPRARSFSREEDSCASRRTPCTCLHLHLHLYFWSVLQGVGSWEIVGRQVRRYHRRGYDQSVNRQCWEACVLCLSKLAVQERAPP